MFKKLLRKDFVLCVALGANVNNADEWLKYADKEMRGEKSKSEMVMTIKTPNWTRTLEIESEVEGKGKALSTIKAPAKEKGIRTLRIDQNMWNYFPKLKRKVAVSSSMLLASWMGSDFTNDDVLKASSMSDDYSHRFIADKVVNGESLRGIENKAKENTKVMWPKIVTYASKTDCLPRIHQYFDKEGKLKRTLTFSDIKTFDGHKFPSHWEMVPEEDKDKRTIIDYKSIQFSPKFKADHFTHKNLTDD